MVLEETGVLDVEPDLSDVEPGEVQALELG